DVAAGSTEARNQAGLDGIASHPENYRDGLRCPGCNGRGNIAADADEDSHFAVDQIGGKRRQLVVVTVRPAVLDLDGLALDKTCISQALWNAEATAAESPGERPPMKPTTGIATCCARAASGHAPTNPPTSPMKSRRLKHPLRPEEN